MWEIATVPFGEAHFATQPPKVPEVAILAGTSPKACPKCLAPWTRVVEKIPVDNPPSYNGSSFTNGKTAATKPNVGQRQRYITVHTDRFEPACKCEGNDGSAKCRVLDPFHGSGTTMQVALELGRFYEGTELIPAYVQLSLRARLKNLQPSLLGSV